MKDNIVDILITLWLIMIAVLPFMMIKSYIRTLQINKVHNELNIQTQAKLKEIDNLLSVLNKLQEKIND